eukprot:2722681-Rhodomonas_salina.4
MKYWTRRRAVAELTWSHAPLHSVGRLHVVRRGLPVISAGNYGGGRSSACWRRSREQLAKVLVVQRVQPGAVSLVAHDAHGAHVISTAGIVSRARSMAATSVRSRSA